MRKTNDSMIRRQPGYGLGILLAGLLGAGSGLVYGGDWPQYRGANHDGVSTEKIVKKWPADGLRQLWKTPLSTGFSAFAVGKGQAFTVVQRSVDGASQEVCLALDAETGKELWATPVGLAKYQGGGDTGAADNRGGDGPRTTPTIDGDRVYVLSAYLGLYCLEVQTGKVIWTKDVLKEYGGKLINWQNAQSPLLDGDLIFVAGTGPGQSLLAFHKSDGSLAWKGQDDKMTHATAIAATLLGERQIIFFTQSGLVAVAPLTGAVLWRYPFPYNVSTSASPVAAGDIVYCSAGYEVGGGAVKITKEGGKFVATEIWRKPKKAINHWSTPVCLNGYLYGMFSFKEFGKGPLKCVELATGNEIWSKDGFGPGQVLLVDGCVLVLDDRGNLVLVEANPKAYTKLARFKAIDGKCWSTPALSNGHIYVRSTKEGACLDASLKVGQK